jgi:hypothetical protein
MFLLYYLSSLFLSLAMYKMFTDFNLQIFNISYVRKVLADVTTLRVLVVC